MSNTTVQSILYFLLIIWAISYIGIYLVKKKKNTHGQSGYKILFMVIFVILAIALASSYL
jgi:hypothetical protein